MRLLISSPSAELPLNYARRHFPPLYARHAPKIMRLMNTLAFLPSISSSPYSDLLSDDVHANLPAEFSVEYCTLLKLSKQLPLRVVGDLGGGGALSKIERGRKVMLERKTEWSAEDELPVRTPLFSSLLL